MTARPRSVHLGFEVGSGEAVSIPLQHLVATGQTQRAGKTTTLEALIARSNVKAIAFVTKRGEGAFRDAREIQPYFREQADWKFVASILEASRGEKLKFERSWIIRASKGAKTLADVQRNVRKAMEKAKGLSADVYLTLDAYLDEVVPVIDMEEWAASISLRRGVNVMVLDALPVEMQHLVIRSTIDWVLNHETDTVVVVPEAWKFVPQGRGTPVKLAAEAFIRQAAGLRNYLWLDSQDIAGVDKIILKSVPIWVLGVQRESNEVKRTLAQIPAGIKKPKPDAIATLGLGQFFVCHDSVITKVYVQPAWMTESQACHIATGERGVHSLEPPQPSEEEPSVNESEARRLREENEQLRRENQQLLRRLETLESRTDAAIQAQSRLTEKIEAPVSTENGTFEAMYRAIKARLIADLPKDPTLLRVLAAKPALEVEVR
ncbi:MAG TPA: hypothetical protein VKU41_18770, partial [Polyangiaceae bacterium]|nr:hypothetical protein [Polyangiaceae bacterium]